MDDSLLFGLSLVGLALGMYLAYRLGFAHGMRLGFKRGAACAGDFDRLKTRETWWQRNGEPKD